MKHMYYAGVTVDTRDEVESQVMIDFEEAFNVEREGWRPKVTRLIGATTSGRSSVSLDDGDGGCNAACCLGEDVHNDSYIDDKLHQDFINSAVAEIQDDSHKFPSAAIFPRSLEDLKTEGNALKDNELLIMSYCVFGFVLRDRTWGESPSFESLSSICYSLLPPSMYTQEQLLTVSLAKLDLEFLEDVAGSGEVISSTADDDSDDEDSSAFGQLVLPRGHKQMVLSLISQHFRNRTTKNYNDEQVDILRGKGR